jgi:hypothetical protein
MLAVYVEEKIAGLRTAGIRGSIEMAVLWDRLNSEKNGDNAQAEAVLANIGTALGTDRSGSLNLVQNLHEDIQVKFIWTLWFKKDP